MIDDVRHGRDQTTPGVAGATAQTDVPLQIAYLINQYPKISHSFIRREILAAEARGLRVRRLALRGWDEPLVDSRDLAEQAKTTYLLRNGVLSLIAATLSVAVRQPRAVLRGLGAALRLSVRSTNPLPYHLVYLAYACRILQILRDEPATHVHAHFGTNSAEIAMLLKIIGGPHYSFTVHGSDEADDGKYLHLDKKVQHAKFVAAISSYTRAQLLRHIPSSDWNKVHVVHCGLDATDFAHRDRITAVADPVFACVGRLSGEKGHFILLDAFSRIAAHHPEARLVLAGDGPLRPALEARIAELGLDAHVRVTRWIDSETVREEILAARALVQPSFQEGLPVVIMEAMALGRPVVSTYVAGIPELVVPKVGWLVPPGDAGALAEAMETCISLPEEQIQRMGVEASSRAKERHNIGVEIDKLVALFAQPS